MSQNWNDLFHTPDDSAMYDTQDIADNKIWAILSYFSFLCFLPLVIGGGKSRYARFHANQGFILFLLEIAAGIVSRIIGWIPVFGGLIAAILSLVLLVFFVLGIFNAATGKVKGLPVIGNILHVFDK